MRTLNPVTDVFYFKLFATGTFKTDCSIETRYFNQIEIENFIYLFIYSFFIVDEITSKTLCIINNSSTFANQRLLPTIKWI